MEIIRWSVLGLILITGLLSGATTVTEGFARAHGVDCARLSKDGLQGAWGTCGLIALYLLLGMLQGGTCGG